MSSNNTEVAHEIARALTVIANAFKLADQSDDRTVKNRLSTAAAAAEDALDAAESRPLGYSPTLGLESSLGVFFDARCSRYGAIERTGYRMTRVDLSTLGAIVRLERADRTTCELSAHAPHLRDCPEEIPAWLYAEITGPLYEAFAARELVQ